MLGIAIAPAKFQPGIAEALGMAVHEQMPFHAPRRIAIWFDPMRRDLAIEQEGQGQGQHPGLARAVVATYQQPAVSEVEALVVVAIEIEQAGAQRLPTLTGRRGKRAGGIGVAGGNGDHDAPPKRDCCCADGAGGSSARQRPSAGSGTSVAPRSRTRHSAAKRATTAAASASIPPAA